MTQETIYEENKLGYTIKIYPDYDTDQNPNDWGNTDVFLVAFHRDFTVERDGYGVEVCRALADKKYAEKDSYEYERAREIEKEYHVFGLEAYIHSGVSLSLSNEGNYPDRRWDVSQLGLVFVSKKNCTRFRKKAHGYAEDLLEKWNAVLSGSVYGFVVEKDGEHVDSCWGFIEKGWNIEDSYVLAEARSVVEHEYKRALTKHIEKRKEQIKKHVPLQARAVLV